MWDPHAFGAAVQRARKAQGLTQERLGQKLGITGQAVSKWETGESAPDVTLLPDLCAALGVSADALLGTTRSQGLDSLIRALREHLRPLDHGERTAETGVAVARLLVEYLDERMEAWRGQDFLAVARREGGGFGHATLLTKHCGFVHIQDPQDLAQRDEVSDDEIASGLSVLADPQLIGILRRLVVDRQQGEAVYALSRQEGAIRDACDRLIEAGYLTCERQIYVMTAAGMLLAATVLLLAARPGLCGNPRPLALRMWTGL